MSLLDNLVFGTSRLSGGAYARESRRLLETCIKAGVGRFDTAPGYGMGASEALIGEVAGEDRGIAVHTKAGSIRPSHPALRGWAKRAYNLLRSPRLPAAPVLIDYSGPAAGCDYSAAALQTSIARSLELLRRDRVDALLLHEAEPIDIDPAAWAVFVRTQQEGRAGALGFAHFGPARQAADGLTVQVAPRSSDFLRPASETRIYHSIRSAGSLSGAADPRVAAAMAAIARRFALTADATGDYVAAMALLARVSPGARLIFATTDAARLDRILEMAARIEPGDLAMLPQPAQSPADSAS